MNFTLSTNPELSDHVFNLLFLMSSVSSELSALPNPVYTKCPCSGCKIVYANYLTDTWYHCGSGLLTDNSYSPESEIITYDPVQVFHEPKTLHGFGIGPKPDGAIWFSRGSWSLDSFSDFSHVNPANRMPDSVSGTAQIKISSPVNVLRVTTLEQLEYFIKRYAPFVDSLPVLKAQEELEWFNHDPYYQGLIAKFGLDGAIEKYSKLLDSKLNLVQEIRNECLSTQFGKLSQKFQLDFSIREKARIVWDLIKASEQIKLILSNEKIQDRSQIDWDMVAADGFWGVAFEFRKVRELDNTIRSIDNEFRFYDGFDVESLIIFDLRAIRCVEHGTFMISSGN